ncbi:MAG: electron transfer flavoprotein subunit beta/FixA family protein [Candidatus Melainabacteria bacterium]|nr:electron transfer flavoprotein subunit beta/FixA family protein [Candidatus Melainabacteria bacterium]MBI3309558.1 electron transfer flavoprotein subunit beta/FixA family protein [Candidatus Melainabacteria bacterium]
MKIVVLVRQTPDTEAKVKVNSDGKTIDPNGITWIINPYDEFAIEKALKIKEQVGSGEVVLLACGPTRSEEAIRQGLAMGADRAVFIKDDKLEHIDPFVTSKFLANELQNIEHDLILSGKKVIDIESSQIPIFVAETLKLPFVTFVMKINEVDFGNKKITVDRESEGKHEIVEAKLPALITCDRGDDHPRYASITGIMKAKKKEIKEISLDSIDLNSLGLSKEDLEKGARTAITNMELPPARKEAKIFEGEIPEKVAALVKALREEAKVI